MGDYAIACAHNIAYAFRPQPRAKPGYYSTTYDEVQAINLVYTIPPKYALCITRRAKQAKARHKG